MFRPHDWQGEITPSPIRSDWSVCPSISRELGVHRYTTVYVYHTTLGRFSKVDCTTTKREDINTEQCVYTSLEISRRDFPTPTLLPPALFEPWRYQPWKIGPGVCDLDRRTRYNVGVCFVSGQSTGRPYRRFSVGTVTTLKKLRVTKNIESG